VRAGTRHHRAQYGWGGETAPGFLKRITNDCLRFKPAIATTCYGMNDHAIGHTRIDRAEVSRQPGRHRRGIQIARRARRARLARLRSLNKNWDAASVESKNLNLCTLRNIDLDSRSRRGVCRRVLAMLTAGYAAQQKHGVDYAIAGKDACIPAGPAALSWPTPF